MFKDAFTCRCFVQLIGHGRHEEKCCGGGTGAVGGTEGRESQGEEAYRSGTEGECPEGGSSKMVEKGKEIVKGLDYA
jgi:hypothetical protein